MQAVTERLGVKHWLWRTDPALTDEPIHGGKVRMVLPHLWGWVKDGIEGLEWSKDRKAIRVVWGS